MIAVYMWCGSRSTLFCINNNKQDNQYKQDQHSRTYLLLSSLSSSSSCVYCFVLYFVLSSFLSSFPFSLFSPTPPLVWFGSNLIVLLLWRWQRVDSATAVVAVVGWLWRGCGGIGKVPPIQAVLVLLSNQSGDCGRTDTSSTSIIATWLYRLCVVWI